MKIIITMELDSEYTDPDHEMGVTEEGFIKITDLLERVGTDIDVSRAP